MELFESADDGDDPDDDSDDDTSGDPPDPSLQLAHQLIARLHGAGLEARIAEAPGELARVIAGSAAARSLQISCTWYQAPSDHAPKIVANAVLYNDRERLEPSEVSSETGPRFSVSAYRGDAFLLFGLSPRIDAVVDAAALWISEDAPERLEELALFLGNERALEQMAARFSSRLRVEIEHASLWIYGDGEGPRRACHFRHSVNGFACSFLAGPSQVALGVGSPDYFPAMAAWLFDRVSLPALVAADPSIQIEPHAELLEEDPARWHWAHLLERVAQPGDSLAPLRPLVEALAGSPIATAFFSYSSGRELCFSASSHERWVDEGLPRVSLRGDAYVIEAVGGETSPARLVTSELRGAVLAIEAALEAAPVRPFFGARAHLDFARWTEAFERAQSPLRPLLLQCGSDHDVVVDLPQGRCELNACSFHGCHVYFPDDERDFARSTLEEGARLVERYRRGDLSLDELAGQGASSGASSSESSDG